MSAGEAAVLILVLLVLAGLIGALVHAFVLEVRDQAATRKRTDREFAPVLRRARLAQAGCGRPSWWPAGGDGEGGRAAHRADRDAVEQAEPAEPVPWPEPFPTNPAEPTTPEHGSAPADHNQPPPVYTQPTYQGTDTRTVGRYPVARRPADVDIERTRAELHAWLADPDRTELTPVVSAKDGAR